MCGPFHKAAGRHPIPPTRGPQKATLFFVGDVDQRDLRDCPFESRFYIADAFMTAAPMMASSFSVSRFSRFATFSLSAARAW